MEFSDKQAHVARLGQRDHRYLLIVGPTQCGKSESGVVGFMQWAARSHSGATFAAVARSIEQMQSVVLPKVHRWCEGVGVELQTDGKGYLMRSAVGPPNKLRTVIGRDGVQAAAGRIQGQTLAGCYVDEFTLQPPSLIEMLDARMSVPGAKMIGTMNPEGPDHWAKIDWVDRAKELNAEHIQFALTDNPTLTPETIEAWKRRFSGAFLRRMVYGEWAATEGLVHPVVRYANVPQESACGRWEVALDFASASVTHALLLGYFGKNVIVADEWRHDGRAQGQMAVTDQAENIVLWATGGGGRSVAAWIIPRDATALAEQIAGRVQGEVLVAADAVLPGLNSTNTMLEGPLRISPECLALRRELGSFRWATGRAQVGDDVPDKLSAAGAHGVDALRYWAHTNVEANAA